MDNIIITLSSQNSNLDKFDGIINKTFRMLWYCAAANTTKQKFYQSADTTKPENENVFNTTIHKANHNSHSHSALRIIITYPYTYNFGGTKIVENTSAKHISWSWSKDSPDHPIKSTHCHPPLHESYKISKVTEWAHKACRSRYLP